MVAYAGLAALTVLLALCCIVLAIYQSVRGPATTTTGAVQGAALKVAYSPEKETFFTALARDFNARRFRTSDGQIMSVEAVRMDPEAMIGAALAGDLQAITPDSSVWLDQLDRAWTEQTGSEATLVGQTARYAVSPVVLAMWEDVARGMGWPDRAVGWEELLARAHSDPNFRWSHPSTTTASGLLATLAEFYAGAGKTRGLTPEDATAQSTLDYVAAIEKTVRYYGEGELAVMERVQAEGRGFLDAFVVSEQLVIDFNRKGGRDRLVAIYPKEGTLWQDHPLALLEVPGLTAGQRQTFARLREFLLSPEVQKRALAAGYRPADLTVPLDGPDSPISPANGADPRQPQTTLQMPGPAVIQVVKDVWTYTKRKTNVILVVDTSGSMEGEKLARAQEGLRAFLEQIKGDQERVGLIEFASGVKRSIELDEMGLNRTALNEAVDDLRARGDTALLDAVALAYDRLQKLGDRERINAIVAMTDGRENHSQISLRELTRRLEEGNRTGVPVVVFCIAYGDDADYRVLEAIASATGGQVRKGDLETIRELYKVLSTYF